MSASCCMVAERFGFGPIMDNGKRAALGAAHRLVMERQGILLNALMQEGRARAEAGRRLSWALGEIGSRADAAMVTMTDGVEPNLMSGSFSPMMGCIETRLLENPDKSEGQDSLDWKYIAKTSSDVRNVVLNDPELVP